MPPGRKRKEYKPEDWMVYPWPDPPSGDLDDYGPTPMQEEVFIYHKEPWERPHYHTLDIVLFIGGAGGGKTICSIANAIELAITFPKCSLVVAGKNMPLLKRNVVDKFGERLSWTSPEGIEYPWQHPMIMRAPSEKSPFCQFINGSNIRFLNIDDPAIVRGFTADAFIIEEVNLMEGASLKEMFRRSRGMALPVRQFVLNMNPTGKQDWVYDMFCLKQFRNEYDGPPIPIGEPCECQFCHVCDGAGLGHFEWEGGDRKYGPEGQFYEWVDATCSNPECPTLLKKGQPQKKINPCPGNQHYYRVVRSASIDNPHLPSDFAQLQRGALSAEEYATYVKGEIVDLNTGYIYKDFSSSNVKPTEFNPDEDILWTMDFNFDPMCSQICQERVDGVHVVDEFTIWNADEKDVAHAFCKRYKGYTGTVWLYGDPNGLNTSRADSNKTSFKVIYDILKLNGFEVRMGMQKVKGQTLIPIITRINNLKAIIKNAEGVCRVFVDPKCINLIESLKHSKWREVGTSPHEDEYCDEVAKENPRRREQAVLMTHPQAALGYLITKRFPLILQKSGVRFLDSAEKTVVAEPQGKELKITKKTTIDYLKEQEDPNRPRSIGSFIPGLNRNSIKERLAYEAAQGEEKQRLQRESLEKFFGGSS